MREEKTDADILSNAEDGSRDRVFVYLFAVWTLVTVNLMPTSARGVLVAASDACLWGQQPWSPSGRNST